jgi:hypothetical protein
MDIPYPKIVAAVRLEKKTQKTATIFAHERFVSMDSFDPKLEIKDGDQKTIHKWLLMD